MSKLRRGIPACNPWYFYIDKVAFRMSQHLSDGDMRLLRANASSVHVGFGRPIRNSADVLILSVVVPNEQALRLLGAKADLTVNYIEIARDIILPDETSALRLRDELDQHFVQPYHGKRELVSKGHSTRTDEGKRAGLQFAWYADRPSKITGEPACFHLEGRHQGVADARRRLGVRAPADLLSIDHAAYWQGNLNLFDVDLERLGRFHRNRQSGSRRQRAAISRRAGYAYNEDLRIGSILYRVFGETKAFAKHCDHVDRSDPEYEVQPDTRIIDRCVQRFVDKYGRGPFLRRRSSPFPIVI